MAVFAQGLVDLWADTEDKARQDVWSLSWTTAPVQNTVNENDLIFDRVAWQLDHFKFPNGKPYQRSIFQCTMHHRMLNNILHAIYGADLQRRAAMILKRNRFDKVVKNTIVSAARRTGKTSAAAMLVASLLRHKPNVVIVVISTYLRTSRWFIRDVRELLVTIDMQGVRVQYSADEIKLWTSASDVRTLTGLPGMAKVCCVSFSLSLRKRPFYRKRKLWGFAKFYLVGISVEPT